MISPMKTAFITGATSGIGRAICQRLVHAGYRIGMISRSEKSMRQLIAELNLDEEQWLGFTADLSLPDSTEAVASEIANKFSEIDVLVHSAGWLERGTIAADDGTLLDRHYQINARAPLVLSHHLLPALRRRQGQIVFINSSVSLQNGKPGLSAYVSSKMMMKGIADCLRQEVNEDGIRVLSVYPGQTATPMQAASRASAGQDYQPEKLLQPKDIAEMVLATLALPRTAEVTDLRIRPMNKS